MGNGELPFASPEVKDAVETMSEIWLNDDYVYGGVPSIVTTFIGDSPVPMFTDPPGCWLHIQSSGSPVSSAMTGWKRASITTSSICRRSTIAWRSGLVAGDIMTMFNDRPEVRALMEYFSTGAGVEQWVKRGGAISPHKGAELDWYSTDIDAGVAELLANATSVRFDASDLIRRSRLRLILESDDRLCQRFGRSGNRIDGS